MQLNPYLLFDGQCEEAFRYYERCLGGKIDSLMRFEGTPAAAHVPAELSQKVLHAQLTLNGQTMLGSDCPPDRFQKPQGFSVTLQVEKPEEAERVFGLLADGGQVQMPIQKTFWAERYGHVVDRFGIPWMVNCASAS